MEQQFYAWLREHLKGDFVRIESVVGNGVPDINVCCVGIDVWIEAKVSSFNRVMLRPEQWAWGHRRASHGGLAYVVCLDDDIRQIAVWQFPDIISNPSGKYVRLVSEPKAVLDKNGNQLMKVLFPMF